MFIFVIFISIEIKLIKQNYKNYKLKLAMKCINIKDKLMKFKMIIFKVKI